MSLTLQNLFTNSTSRFTLHFTTTTTASNPKNTTTVSLPITSRHVTSPLHSRHYQFLPHHPHPTLRLRLRATTRDEVVAVGGGNSNFNFDSFLSVAEFLCLASSLVGLAANLAVLLSSKKAVLVELVGNKVWAWWGIALLAGGVAIGSWIRRRQWQRLCGQTWNHGGGGVVEVNLLERIEKLEEDLRSSATIIRVLSRQLEKLGIRFRVTRKTLKDPIAETAALAQKNSEATRALAVQEDILEKELVEIQKVLLAMQEQQQKQLELILAIGKAGKLWESKREQNEEQDTIETSNSAEEGLKWKETQQI
ncbi:hypothetical protein RGQ29_022009 [Quercus rubra]|uniref:Transmembrane protein n=1 Tax=Quercus rubra TaxID=3512 RepID=A0AAN7F230_QUERU|nr:hypothetical protein RGQ29_022009 [Quercus rubra]